MSLAIEARRLSKEFGSLKALDAVDFQVDDGEIFGLIGADGAGKTTCFRILAGVLQPDAGTVRVLGRSPRDSREQVGYLTQPFSLYLDLSVMENLRYTAGLRAVSSEEFDQRSKRYLELFDLKNAMDRLAGRLSGGMKQKLALSCALISDPRVLLLDEPTTGVDPVSRRDFWDALTSLATRGMTIVVATPYLDEAERCHRVALMERGKICRTDTPEGFRASVGLTRLAIHSSDLVRAESTLSGSESFGDVQRFGDRLDVMVENPDRAEPELHRLMDDARIEVQAVRRSRPTLENAFVARLRAMRGRKAAQPFPDPTITLSENGNLAVEAIGLVKRFGDFRAVKTFDLRIKNGEIYGLLGANGAGKTTAIKMICGLLTPTSGTVTLMGRKDNLRGADVRSRIGYMSQKFTLYDDLSIRENLDFYARLYGIEERVREARKRWVLEIADLRDEADMLTGLLPGGWKQRVSFGAAVMHEPSVLFLDEPTSGVDPLARRAMWRMINEMADRGAAILVVTHYLEEAEQCNRIGFMVAGEIIAEGSPGEIKRQMSGTLLEIETNDPQRALAVLKSRMGASRVSLFGDRIHCAVDGDKAAPANWLTEQGIKVRRVEPIEFSLEDVFISLIENRRHLIPQ